MNTAIICGGPIDNAFATSFLKQRHVDCIIAADKGLKFCYEEKIFPNYILGDYDSIRPEILEWYRSQSDVPVVTYPTEKDDTDTAIALKKALEIGSDKIYLLGALGGRMDHAVANIQILKTVLDYTSIDRVNIILEDDRQDVFIGRSENISSKVGESTLEDSERNISKKIYRGVEAYIVDSQNLICLIEKEIILKKKEQFGKYVSLLPFTDTVEGITLEGFKYPLYGYTMKKGESTGVSNEIVDVEAKVTLRSGILLMIQSRD